MRLADDLDRLSAGIAALRGVYRLIHGRHGRTDEMTIEIKGLGATVQRAREGIQSVRRASGDLEVATSALASDIDGITQQVKQHHDDLRAEAEILRNGGPPLEQSSPASPAPFQQPGAGNSATGGA